MLVNGSPIKDFKMGIILRQGDPLSSFLFMIAVERFNTLMKKAEDRGLYSGYRFQKGEDRFSQLQYTDDTMIIRVKRWSNIRIIKLNLRLFELMSGLKVNFQKSFIARINVSQEWLSEAARILNYKIGDVPISYLDILIEENPKKKEIWKKVVHSMRNILSRWKNKHLSLGGRVVLLKFVMFAIPIYFLSFFKAPEGIISK